jgi:peptidoglycan hydrolase-like protein with peptidoglycan-binding domain
MLAVMSSYIPGIPPVAVDGIYGPATRAAVLASQRRFGLPETGVVDARTWDEIYDQYSGIENTSLRSKEIFPQNRATVSSSQTAALAGNFRNNRSQVRTSAPSTAPVYSRTTTITQFPGFDLRMGTQDPIVQEVVR